MEKKYLLILMIVTLFGVLSCNQDQSIDSWLDGDVLILSSKVVNLDDVGKEKSIRVTTNIEDYEVSSSESWCTYIINGNTLIISAEANEMTDSRTAIISILAGDKSTEIIVRQAAGSVEVSDPSSDDINISGIDLIKIDGGTFMMGSQNTDPSAPNYGVANTGSNYNANQSPVHEVTLSDYYIGKFAVTMEQWKSVMGTDPSLSSQNSTGLYPAAPIDYDMAVEFCEKLSQQTGKTFRLPTEAEWEYAARGGKKSKGYLYSGSDDPFEVGIFTESARGDHGYTAESGSLKPNELGIYDMSGNVYEWVSDYCCEAYSDQSSIDPTGPESGTKRGLRGASWAHKVTTVYFRGSNTPDYVGRDDDPVGFVGFRVVYKE